MGSSRSGAGLARGAAVLVGLSSPAAKLLAGTVDPWLLAGLLSISARASASSEEPLGETVGPERVGVPSASDVRQRGVRIHHPLVA